ncbi:MAG: biotin/lipoyl-binding protein, partial [Chloroflexota bacterium]
MRAGTAARRGVCLLFAGFFILAVAGCDVLATAPPPTPTPAPKATPTPQRATVQVTRGTIVDAIKVLGRVVSSREADLSFRNSGRIREVFVQPGDMVEPGQVLAELDQHDLPWNLAKAQVSVQQAQVRLAAAQAKSVMDDTALDQFAVRSAQIGLAQAQLNLERTQAGPLAPAVRKAEADAAKAQADLDRARFELSNTQAELAAKQAEVDATMQGPEPLAVLQARADVEAARIKVEQAKVGTHEADVRAAQIALDEERTKLDRLRDVPQVRAEEIANARLDVEMAQARLAKVLADIDAGLIKGEEDRSIAVRAAQLALEKAQNTYTSKSAAATPSPREIQQQEQAVTLAELQLAKVKSQPGFDLEAAQVDLAAKQAQLDQLLAGPSESEIAAFNAELQALQVAVETATQNVKAAEAGLAAAQARLGLVTREPTEIQVQQARNQIALAENAIETAQVKLTASQEALSQQRAVAAYDLEQLRRTIQQATLEVQSFEAQTGDVKIVAPFAGRITRLAGRPGDTVQA